MSYTIELLDRDGRVVSPPREFLTLAGPFIERMLGDHFPHATVLLLLYTIPGTDNDVPGEPYLTYQSTSIGYAQVRIINAGRVIYRHPHTIGEIVAQGIRQWLTEITDVSALTGYRLVGPNIAVTPDRATPEVAGVTEIQPYAEGEQPAFRIRPIPPPAPTVRSLASFQGRPLAPDWLKPGRTDFVKVLVDDAVHEELTRLRPFSLDVEEGGFLVGHVYEDADHPGTFLLRLTAARQTRFK